MRNAPDDVAERLSRLAARDGTSVAAVAVRELAEVSRRADDAWLLDGLPDRGVATQELLEDLGATRASQ